MAAPAARAPAARAPRRDALAEQQLVRDLWQQVEARVNSSNALRAFLTQKIDDCGQTIAFDAFDLVRQVLNPDGFVRRAHKSADQNLGAAITMPESPWSAEGSFVDRQWDFHGTWHKNRKMWPSMNEYENLQKATVQYFCTESALDNAGYDEPAEYIDGDTTYDFRFSMPALAANQDQLKILKKLPDNPDIGKSFRRWETFRVDFSAENVENCMKSATKKFVCSKASSRKPKQMAILVGDLQKRLKAYMQRNGLTKKDLEHEEPNKDNKKFWSDELDRLEKEEVLEREDNDDTESDAEDNSEDDVDDPASAAPADANAREYKLEEMIQEKVLLEPYYRLAWRSHDWARNNDFLSYGYGKKHKMCNQQERPDLIIEVGYFSADSGLFTKRVVMIEIDGENKTSTNTKKIDQDDDDKESAAKKKDDPIKLALKLMSSTFAQNALQDDTYHIRANYVWFFDRKIDSSLLSTTSFELPEVEDLIRLYGKDSKSSDYTTLHQAIHFVHHMYTAHVKIAFLMFMKVVHNIDMRSLDTINKQMCNHSFFVNFEAEHMPEELVWENKMPVATRTWLENQQMLHTSVSIKTYDDDVSSEKWVKAPVMNPTTQRTALQDWHADVDTAPLPRFPYEKNVAVPVKCVTIQRVDIKKLVHLVHIAASKASNMYYEAIKLTERTTKVNYGDRTYTMSIKRRSFPDKCFLSRAQQLGRHELWNDVDNDDIDVLLNQRQINMDDNPLDFYWGYEDPNVKRHSFKVDIDYQNADEIAWRQWDQLDVRMHFFNKAMQEDDSWKDAVNGMWYLQDYHAFFDMLRNLPKPNLPHALPENRLITTVPEEFVAPRGTRNVNREAARLQHQVKSLAASKYAFEIKRSNKMHEAFPTDDTFFGMPVLSETSERAHHMFSILAWFFDCRDAGACRWQWEDKVLDYFGVDLPLGSPDSDFDKFRFQKKKDANTTDTKYFDNTWFLMTVFLEVNFRNALAALHCRLWEKQEHTRSVTGKNGVGLQVKAKELYNRQRSLLNTRARCVGLQGVSAGLSWQKNSERNCLRNLLLSSLDDTLPGLDPQLEAYLRQFNAPNAGLFLRTIEVSNVLALRELALQHKLASQSGAGASKLEARLAWFEPAVQSEIRHLMHIVERDDSVFTAAPVVHPTKAIVLEEELMRKWVRQTLGVHRHLHSLRCPLDVKFHMFTSPETYRVFMQLFCTKTQLDNSHTQRPVLFVLLQVWLAAEVLKGTKEEFDDDVVVENTAVNKVQRTNPVLEMRRLGSQVQCHRKYTIDIVDGVDNIPCTPGSSLSTWPLRDQNLWCKPTRDVSKKVQYAPVTRSLNTIDEKGLEFKLDPRTNEMLLVYPAEDDQISRDMADEELRRWLLLACARPGPCRYERQDDGRYTGGEKKHEFTAQDCTVRQQAEWPHESDTGRQRDTIIAAVASFEVLQNRLQVTLCDDADMHLFFETVEQPEHAPESFPQYIKDIVTHVPNRTRIYVPQVFASHLRKEQQGLHDKIYEHDGKYWRMVCVGYRAWAWKRLLVKSIFFDALTKVVTRSSVLLSLLQSPRHTDSEPEDLKNLNQLYQDMMADTKDTFGALELKTDKIRDNWKRKKMQVVLTVFRRENRVGSIKGRAIKFHDTIKVPAAQRQVEWCQYYRDNTPQQTTCRFLLIDKRMHKALLPNIQSHTVKDCDVLQYRSYLYLVSKDIQQLRHAVVSLQGKLYVKFPSTYAVLNSSTGSVETGEVIHNFEKTHFATCWDCRRYSCLRPEYLLVPDSDTITHILLTNTPPEALYRNIAAPGNWRSTAHDDLDTCKYICRNTRIDYFHARLFPFIEHSTSSITYANQATMYTLPDMFLLERDAHFDIPEMAKVDDWNDVKFISDIVDEEDVDEECKLWNKLRNSSKYIATEHTADPQDGNNRIVHKVLDTGDASFAPPFTEIMATLRRRILPKTNEDS
jgi:hypothetical protein